MSADYVEIWFPIEKDKNGYPESQNWEELWGSPSQYGYRIESIPFFLRNVALGDTVLAEKSDKDFVQFQSIVSRGGHSTYRIWVDQNLVPHIQKYLHELETLGAKTEVTLERLVAVDAPPRAHEQIRGYLVEGLQSGKWFLEDGYVAP